MIRRLIELLSLTAVGGSAALALGAEPLQLIGGAGTGAMIWLMIDQHRLGRFRDWLRQAHPAAPPNLPDDWTELIERSQKGFKLLQRETRKVEDRLQQLIAAFEASPNGLLVLDSAERIILCNQAVADHLRFDVKRDLGQHLRNLLRDPAFIAYLNGSDYSQPVEIQMRALAGAQPSRISLQLHPYGFGNKLLLTRDITSV